LVFVTTPASSNSLKEFYFCGIAVVKEPRRGFANKSKIPRLADVKLNTLNLKAVWPRFELSECF